jgi:hypothetical protein
MGLLNFSALIRPFPGAFIVWPTLMFVNKRR